MDTTSTNLKDTWYEWKEAWQLYSVASGILKKDVSVQSATIQSLLGPNARRILKTLPNIDEKPLNRTVRAILDALEEYCIPRKNVTYERYMFRVAMQGERCFDEFRTDLRSKADNCEFGEIKDSLVRDQIVILPRTSRETSSRY